MKPRGDWGANKIFFLVAANSRLHRSFARTNLSLLACAPNNTASYADYCIESGWLDFDVAGCVKLCHFVMALFVRLFLNKGK